ncbi:MAG: hypothetical protein IT381_22720 [Deltaproteobacteria bacterium]|nr:hypothetical protein [Deltaproteobacteria bacterium]
MLTEAQIADLYQRHGHALHQVCLRLAPSKSAAKELVLAAFCELSKKRVRLGGFDTLCRLASELARSAAAAPVSDDDVVFARYLADDLSTGKRHDLEQRLAASPPAQVKLAVMRSDRTTFFASDPPAEFARRVATILASRGERTTSVAWLYVSGALAIVAVAGALAWPHVQAMLAADRAPVPVIATQETPPPASIPVAPTTPPPSEDPEPPLVDVAPSRAEPPEPAEAATAPGPAKPPPLIAKVDPKPRPASQPTSQPGDAARMMATFDFGEPLGRVSIYEGRSKQKAVPAGTSLQVRANIPEPGYAAVLALDPTTKTLQALTTVLRVEPRWHVLGRFTIDREQRVYMIFSTEQLSLATITQADPKAPLPVERQARIDLTIEAAPAE